MTALYRATTRPSVLSHVHHFPGRNYGFHLGVPKTCPVRHPIPEPAAARSEIASHRTAVDPIGSAVSGDCHRAASAEQPHTAPALGTSCGSNDGMLAAVIDFDVDDVLVLELDRVPPAEARETHGRVASRPSSPRRPTFVTRTHVRFPILSDGSHGKRNGSTSPSRGRPVGPRPSHAGWAPRMTAGTPCSSFRRRPTDVVAARRLLLLLGVVFPAIFQPAFGEHPRQNRI